MQPCVLTYQLNTWVRSESEIRNLKRGCLAKSALAALMLPLRQASMAVTLVLPAQSIAPHLLHSVAAQECMHLAAAPGLHCAVAPCGRQCFPPGAALPSAMAAASRQLLLEMGCQPAGTPESAATDPATTDHLPLLCRHPPPAAAAAEAAAAPTVAATEQILSARHQVAAAAVGPTLEACILQESFDTCSLLFMMRSMVSRYQHK